MPPPRQPSASDTEFNIANRDVERALHDLASNPLTTDITPEIQGWAEIDPALRSRNPKSPRRAGLDPTNRDKVFARRRQLGEYARLARFVGSMAAGNDPEFSPPRPMS